jgi:hypothetical protein
VPVSSIADDIDKDVLLESLAVLHCDLHALVKNIGFISVYVDDWCIYCLGDLCAVVG